jgi:DNA-directed RNA polymerase beta' subunit
MSMMQHSVVPLPYKTFRLNVSVTKPYNADFFEINGRQQGKLKV